MAIIYYVPTYYMLGPYSGPLNPYPTMRSVLDLRKQNPKELSNAQEHIAGKHHIKIKFQNLCPLSSVTPSPS